MGCDIHAHLEVKINGTWYHATMPRIQRSYSLFSRMANVRNVTKNDPGYIEPISEPRGLPSDITFLTKFHSDYMDSDGHSHSYLNCKELSELIEWYDNKKKDYLNGEYFSWEMDKLGFLFGNGWNVQKYPNDFPKGVEDTRIVFWFDN